MILDEAHHIKNYMSKKWQVLLCFNTCRRLLLSGTPLQNNILELWSLLHFLMPYVFNSRKEFAYWFADPLNKAVENGIDSSMMNQLNHGGDAPGSNTGIVSRLHTIIRPFILRRLKSEVATQLPNKYEYVLYCKMSKRQLYLYEEFISRNNMGGTKAAASSNSYISMMNILMQLRKICNHPNLLEPRVIHTPYIFNQLYFYIHKGMHFASQPFRMTDLSLHYLRLYDIKTQAIFVEDVHVSTLQHALVETKDKTIATFIRECLSRYQQLYASELHSTASSATLPRLVPSFLAVISSRMCSQLFKHVDVGHKHVRTWRNVTLHDSLSTQLLQSYFDLQHSFSLMVPKVLSSGVSSNITYMSNEERLFRTPYYSLSSEPQAKELGSDALSTCQQVLLQRRLLIFPDKKFIQYDCGKLQLLAQLLHKIKQNKLHSSTGESHGSHHGRSNKVLIFTQMSKMLDILEIFLNLHQFTFVRLDGSTSVDKRQYLMDRFNNDEKIFVFILSTRSGGLGINLTGANHVIFYDTDWNPAMDAQAQDRAHRIGQTRDVHIYRLITESTIEENILLKNRQKKKLDILVMNQGNFKQDVLLLKSAEYNQANSSDLLLSAYDKVIGNNSSQPEASALQQYEDAEDVQMLQRTAKEMSEELQEFDEKNIVPTDKDADEEAAEDEARGESGTKTSSQGDKALQQIVLVANDEKAVEEEFNSFLTSHGNTTFELIQSQLSAVDRYAMQFRTVCEPFYSMYFVNFAHKTQELLLESNANALNIEEIEAKKEAEELQAITNGDIIASFSKKGGASSVPLIQMETIKLVRQVRKWRRWYIQERRKKVLQYKLDKLMGKEWVMYSYNNAGTGRRQAASVVTYYHNFVTNEISYAKPKILEINEEYAEAQKKKFNHIPNKALLTILSYLPRHPEHTTLLPLVNRHFYAAVHDSVFVCKVLSIENSNSYQQSSSSKLSKEKVFLGLHEALATCQSYDRVYLSPGHHWINSAELAVSRHVIIYSDESAECIVELSGRLVVEQGVKLLLANIVIRSPDKVPYTIHSTTTPSVPAASAVTTESTSIILAKPGCSISANNLQVVLYQQPVSMRQLHQQSSNSNISYVLQHKSAVWELQGAKVGLTKLP
ncbi:hypothetical protein EON64_00170 [archaeon]|nr:MAG: hypothetical protein EON64_00170 [archaeon]